LIELRREYSDCPTQSRVAEAMPAVYVTACTRIVSLSRRNNYIFVSRPRTQVTWSRLPTEETLGHNRPSYPHNSTVIRLKGPHDTWTSKTFLCSDSIKKVVSSTLIILKTNRTRPSSVHHTSIYTCSLRFGEMTRCAPS
jgi:hypothetical protein